MKSGWFVWNRDTPWHINPVPLAPLGRPRRWIKKEKTILAPKLLLRNYLPSSSPCNMLIGFFVIRYVKVLDILSMILSPLLPSSLTSFVVLLSWKAQQTRGFLLDRAKSKDDAGSIEVDPGRPSLIDSMAVILPYNWCINKSPFAMLVSKKYLEMMHGIEKQWIKKIYIKHNYYLCSCSTAHSTWFQPQPGDSSYAEEKLGNCAQLM